MRLWSLHPEYLDAKGLVALWREALLAQKVLEGKTTGYRHHPQLARFRNSSNPQGAIASYLRPIVLEADKRGYKFNREKILNRRLLAKIPLSDGQLNYEFEHLLKKLKTRDPQRFDCHRRIIQIKTHPLFEVHPGEIEPWEIR